MKSFLFLCSLSILALQLPAQIQIPNPSFELGEKIPDGWRSMTATGRFGKGDAAAGERYIEVAGTGEDDGFWLSAAPLALEAGKLYRIGFQARSPKANGGTAVTGPIFCNVDIGVPPAEWKTYTNVFYMRDDLPEESVLLRFGQWHLNGKVQFDDIRIEKLAAVYAETDGITLGEGETLFGNTFTCNAPLGGASRNHCRALESAACNFNSNRWTFGSGNEVIYAHNVNNLEQTSGEIEITVGYYVGGKLVVEGKSETVENWQPVGELGDKGTLNTKLPEKLFPARNLRLRLRAVAKQKVGSDKFDPGSFQVHAYKYSSRVNTENKKNLKGNSKYVVLKSLWPGLEVNLRNFGEAIPGGKNVLQATVANIGNGKTPRKAKVSLRLRNGAQVYSAPILTPTFFFGNNSLEIPYEIPAPGNWTLELDIAGKNQRYSIQTECFVPDFYATHYGELLPGSSSALGIWRASSGWKIPRERSLPSRKAKCLEIATARNEAEATQLILRPTETLKNVRLEATDPTGPGKTRLKTEIFRVYYHAVERPTDKTGVVAHWPDALPPMATAIDLQAGKNQPFWIRVKPPASAPGGLYRGSIRISTDERSINIPLQIRVFDFALPKRMTCETAFGFSPNSVFRYQKISDPGQKRQVLDKYLRNFSDHHISPYNPAPLDPISIEWPGSAWIGGRHDQNDKAEGAASLLVEDNSTTAGAGALYGKTIPVPSKGMRLRFSYKTSSPGHAFIITILHNDANGNWLSGCNNDITITGDGTWQVFDREITRFHPQAKTVNLRLWATRYAVDGHYTGAVRYDQLQLTDLASGKKIIDDSFIPHDAAKVEPKIDWSRWDKAMTKAIDDYGFNTFRFSVRGLGGGTFHARYEPEILGYPGGSAEYNAIMKTYLGKIQEHLRGKGWLDEAFIYWFDEPAPRDYAFVMNGFKTLKTHAPDLRRMLTEQVEPALIDGPNLWCPVSSHYKQEDADLRRREGDDFWWYICTGPKAPYCTLFIDHPGSELRVWLWQTWKRNISGILVWQSNYWSSAAAYPEQPQNPYLDPMGWVSGYSTPKGTKRAWGNGDGRFIYPPLRAADANPPAPVLEGPVDSIRWEMLRDGIEDYEYHAILKKLLTDKALSKREREKYQKLLIVPETITRTATEFTIDPTPIERRRRQLAEAIEKLGRK